MWKHGYFRLCQDMTVFELSSCSRKHYASLPRCYFTF